MRILIVEDEIDLAESLRQGLAEEGFAVDVAFDGRDGLFNATTWPYDLIVLDLMLPKLDGASVLKRLRETVKTPVLILTAKDAVRDRVELLNLGADDYLCKPFAFEELLARLRALCRRSQGEAAPVLRIRDLEIDTVRREVTKGGVPVTLTAKEYALLELLVAHRDRLVTREMIYDHVYAEDDDSLSNVVDVYISNLRRKLGADLIVTRRGYGYHLHV